MRSKSDLRWDFFRGFLREPQVVASIVPSSRFLERRVVEAAGVAGTGVVVVELGPGTGGTTRALLSAMAEDSTLLAIERTAEFADGLARAPDPRLTVVHGCASGIRGELATRALGLADVVVSGIPFTTLPRRLGRRIIAEVYSALRPGGRFVAYQVRDRVAELAQREFGAPAVRRELRNIPPMRIYTWRKPDIALEAGNAAG